MADADLTYDFDEIPRFVAELEEGAELVMGDRMDNIQPGAMPWLHQYIGNPILTGLLNLFFRTGISDAHCGMRALRRDVLPRLDLRTTGMEFASEMVIRASKENLRSPSSRSNTTRAAASRKLSSFRDGWRHLRFLLVHSPTHLFILPGAVLAGLGALFLVSRGVRARPVRARLGRARDHRRRAADDRRHAGARARSVRARLRHLLHGRARPVVRPHARALPPRARSGARRRCSWWSASSIGGLILVDLDLARLRIARLTNGSRSSRRRLIIVGIQIFFSSFLLSILGLRRNS